MNAMEKRLQKLEAKLKKNSNEQLSNEELFKQAGYDLSNLAGETDQEKLRTFINLQEAGMPTPDECWKLKEVWDSV